MPAGVAQRFGDDGFGGGREVTDRVEVRACRRPSVTGLPKRSTGRGCRKDSTRSGGTTVRPSGFSIALAIFATDLDGATPADAVRPTRRGCASIAPRRGHTRLLPDVLRDVEVGLVETQSLDERRTHGISRRSPGKRPCTFRSPGHEDPPGQRRLASRPGIADPRRGGGLHMSCRDDPPSWPPPPRPDVPANEGRPVAPPTRRRRPCRCGGSSGECPCLGPQAVRNEESVDPPMMRSPVGGGLAHGGGLSHAWSGRGQGRSPDVPRTRPLRL